MKHPVGVKVGNAIEDLPHDGLDHHIGQAFFVFIFARPVMLQDLLQQRV